MTLSVRLSALTLVLFIAAGGELSEQRDAVQIDNAGIRLYPESVSESVSAPTYDCQRLRNGQWLQVVIMHRDQRGFEWHECLYGRVLYRAGDANL